jgi:hypothetical protein
VYFETSRKSLTGRRTVFVLSWVEILISSEIFQHHLFSGISYIIFKKKKQSKPPAKGNLKK